MKHVKKILSSIAIFAIAIQGVYSAPLGVNEIEVLDENTLKVTLSENPNLEVGEIEAEVTILHDVKLYGGFVSQEAANKVELLLENPILPNTKYSLLTLIGAEGSIDFQTPEVAVEGFATTNISPVSEQDIDGIEIIDDRTIVITYTQDIEETTLEYKLLAESTVMQIEKPEYDIPELVISLEPPLVSGQDYILMFIEMQDVDGEYLEFDTGIYDFSTPPADEVSAESGTGTALEEDNNEDNIQEDVSENTSSGSILEGETGTGLILEENEAGTALEEDNNEDNIQEDTLDLNSAPENVSLEKDTDEVAMSMETTPDTGAATWVLILATLIINTFYYSARRKKSQLA